MPLSMNKKNTNPIATIGKTKLGSTNSTASGNKSNKAAPKIVPAENAMRKFNIIWSFASERLKVNIPTKESKLIKKVAINEYKVL